MKKIYPYLTDHYSITDIKSGVIRRKVTMPAAIVDYQLYVWGENAHGELGLGHSDPVSSPLPVPTLNNVIAVSFTPHSILCLTDQHEVYYSGMNCWGLVINDDLTTIHPFQVINIERFGEITNILACNNFYLVNSKGEIYGLDTYKLTKAFVTGDGSEFNGTPAEEITSSLLLRCPVPITNIKLLGNTVIFGGNDGIKYPFENSIMSLSTVPKNLEPCIPSQDRKLSCYSTLASSSLNNEKKIIRILRIIIF